MADLIISNVVWKKGERGNQRLIIYDSDGTTKHNLTGHSYTFKFWKDGASSNKGSGSLTIIDAVNGEAEYAVLITDTDTVNRYIGEIVETDTNLKTSTFAVEVLETAPA
ncbi:MAG: hypothetical protein ACREBU_22760 [Nitrososphaera sp.]